MRPRDGRSTIPGFQDATTQKAGPLRAEITEANKSIAEAIKSGNTAQVEELRALKASIERLIGVAGGTVGDKIAPKKG